MTKICIRQPGYLPSLGFFKKIESAEIFVFLDDVNYSRGDWDNRNKIKTMEDSMWLTVPILNKSSKLLQNVPKWSQSVPQDSLKSTISQARAPKSAQTSKKLPKCPPRAPKMEPK